jgi:hypothetical protein
MPMSNGFVRGGPLILLRIEGAAVLAAATLVYAHIGQSWWMFAALILVPDISMLGYLANTRIGAACYNAVHTVTAPVLLAGLGAGLGSALIISIAAIWLAHIGLDRMLGYGLKYATSFTHTHLGLLGRRTAPAT